MSMKLLHASGSDSSIVSVIAVILTEFVTPGTSCADLKSITPLLLPALRWPTSAFLIQEVITNDMGNE